MYMNRLELMKYLDKEYPDEELYLAKSKARNDIYVPIYDRDRIVACKWIIEVWDDVGMIREWISAYKPKKGGTVLYKIGVSYF